MILKICFSSKIQLVFMIFQKVPPPDQLMCQRPFPTCSPVPQGSETLLGVRAFIPALPLLPLHLINNQQIYQIRLLWWLSGKEPTCQCWGHRFDHLSEKISHASEQLSLCTTTIEPTL